MRQLKDIVFSLLVSVGVFVGMLFIFFINTSSDVYAVSPLANCKTNVKGDSRVQLYLFGDSSVYINEIVYDSISSRIGINLDINNKLYSNSQMIWHNRFKKKTYYTFEIIRNNQVISQYKANGDSPIKEFYTYLGGVDGIQLEYGDVIHSQFIQNENKQDYTINEQLTSKEILGSNAYFLLTESGLINVKDTIVYQSYNADIRYNYICLNNTNSSNSAITTFSEKGTSVIHRNFPNQVYHSITQYNVSNHNLNTIVADASGLGSDSNDSYLNQFTNFKPYYGDVYKIYNKEPKKAKIYHNGVVTYSNSNDFTNTDYFEFTAQNGLVKLNFDKVKGGTKKLELNSDISNIIPADGFTDASSYKDIEVVSFGKTLTNNKLETYNMPINLKERLTTNSNYINFSVMSKVLVVDTTAPTADPVSQTVFQDDKFDKDPFSLITNLEDNDDIQNISAIISKIPDTSKVGMTSAEVRLTDKSGNSSIIVVPVTVISKKAQLTVEFVNDMNQILTPHTVTIETEIGDTIDLTQNDEVQKQLTNITLAGYNIVERPKNENSISINDTNVTVQYKLQGLLSLTSVPSTIDFGTLTYDATTKRVEAPSFDKPFIVTDTRTDTINGWCITASLTTPMENSNGEKLVNALRYVHQGKETLLGQAAQVVYTDTKGTSGSYNISDDWGTTANTDGIKLQIDSSDTVYTGDYVGVITWKVMAGQP